MGVAVRYGKPVYDRCVGLATVEVEPEMPISFASLAIQDSESTASVLGANRQRSAHVVYVAISVACENKGRMQQSATGRRQEFQIKCFAASLKAFNFH